MIPEGGASSIQNLRDPGGRAFFYAQKGLESELSPFLGIKKPAELRAAGFWIDAEKEGFEPPVPLGTPVFKTGAIDHSATSPAQKYTFCPIRKKQSSFF